MPEAVRCETVSRWFSTPAGRVAALREVSLSVEEGELVALVGRSGSGKTTLLGILGGLDRADSGSVVVDGAELGSLSERALTEYRLRCVSFVFQSPGLVPRMTAAENVALGLELRGDGEARARAAALAALERVGLAERARHRAYELSGGEQQRVALARALVRLPRLLLADEPTGQLDTETGAAIMALLGVIRDDGTTVIVATHDRVLADAADRALPLRDGRLV